MNKKIAVVLILFIPFIVFAKNGTDTEEDKVFSKLDLRKVVIAKWGFTVDDKYFDFKKYNYKAPIYNKPAEGKIVGYLMRKNKAWGDDGKLFDKMIKDMPLAKSHEKVDSASLYFLLSAYYNKKKRYYTFEQSLDSKSSMPFTDIVDLKGNSLFKSKSILSFDIEKYSRKSEHFIPYMLYERSKIIKGDEWLQFISKDNRQYWMKVHGKAKFKVADNHHMLVMRSTNKYFKEILKKAGARIDEKIIYYLRMKKRKKNEFVFYPAYTLECNGKSTSISNDPYPVKIEKESMKKIDIPVNLDDLRFYLRKSRFKDYFVVESHDHLQVLEHYMNSMNMACSEYLRD